VERFVACPITSINMKLAHYIGRKDVEFCEEKG
jgi:hypothetical protein